MDYLKLKISIRIERPGPRGGSGEGITLAEEISLNEMQFLEVATLLRRFSEVAEEVRALRNERLQLDGHHQGGG